MCIIRHFGFLNPDSNESESGWIQIRSYIFSCGKEYMAPKLGNFISSKIFIRLVTILNFDVNVCFSDQVNNTSIFIILCSQ